VGKSSLFGRSYSLYQVAAAGMRSFPCIRRHCLPPLPRGGVEVCAAEVPQMHPLLRQGLDTQSVSL
ncbi:MAG: hypothetical protein IJF34_11280, partial [Clostridia bacterium]|nr:hypothetical protein [Clostridia bacterium]